MITEINDILEINKLLANFNVEIESKGIYSNYYVYIEDKVVLGFISFDIIFERAELNYIFVNKEKRKQGIATKLFNYMLNVCKAKNCENITLEVRENNKSAINFYIKNGFKEVAKREKYYKDEDGILMIKEMK